MKGWLRDRLKERSTWVGISIVLGAAGLSVPVDAVQLVGTAVLALLSATEMIRKERD